MTLEKRVFAMKLEPKESSVIRNVPAMTSYVGALKVHLCHRRRGLRSCQNVDAVRLSGSAAYVKGLPKVCVASKRGRLLSPPSQWVDSSGH